MMDGLGLPTPPEMIDKYTLHPTLTDEEYQKKLSEDKIRATELFRADRHR